jgi:5-methylcytosine-specific restriction endonuclease McrA
MTKKRVSARLRRQVEERARGCCEYCRSQSRFATESFSAEHVIPGARGGETSLENLAHACQGCNNFKYDKTEGEDPLSGLRVPLFHPRRHRWREHFVWTENFTLIQGITAIGRATVDVLRLNRDSLVNLRHVLYILGEHPPGD